MWTVPGPDHIYVGFCDKMMQVTTIYRYNKSGVMLSAKHFNTVIHAAAFKDCLHVLGNKIERIPNF